LARSGYRPVELGLDQRPDVDTIDREVHDLAVDVDVDQLDPAHHDAAHFDGAEQGLTQVAGAELRTAEVNALEPGSPQILTVKVSHSMTVTALADMQAHRHGRAERAHRHVRSLRRPLPVVPAAALR